MGEFQFLILRKIDSCLCFKYLFIFWNCRYFLIKSVLIFEKRVLLETCVLYFDSLVVTKNIY